MYEGGSSAVAHPGQVEGPPGGERGAVKERSFWVGLLLYIVTFGVYQYYYHYKTHDELTRELGRENRESGLFWTWVGVNVVGTLAALFFVAMIVNSVIQLEGASEERIADQIIGIAMSSVLLLVALTVVFIGSLIVFVIYVSKQYELLQTFRRTASLSNKPGAGWFFGFYYGAAIAVDLFTFGMGSLVFKPLAYYNLVEHYNEVRRYFDGRIQPLSFGGPAPGAAGAANAPTWADPAATGAGPAALAGHGATQPGTGVGNGAGAAAPAAPADHAGGSWGRRPDEHTFSVGGRRGPHDAYGDSTAVGGPMVKQAFKCPRCHAHVEAAGPPGATVDLHCTGCGETGRVPLPNRV